MFWLRTGSAGLLQDKRNRLCYDDRCVNSMAALNLEEPESTPGRVRELRGLWNGHLEPQTISPTQSYDLLTSRKTR